MAKIIDISVPIYNGMLVYPGDAGAAVEPFHQIAKGDAANLSELRLGSHTGTHIDAPRHFVEGAEPVDRLPLDVLVGWARVLDLTGVKGQISPSDLEKAGMKDARRILLKTSNSGLWNEATFCKEFVSLSNEAADFLVRRGIKLVAVDYLSIERFHPEKHYVHKTLLGESVVIVEGVNLGGVEPGEYKLVCLPLRIRDADGSPARAILIER